MANETWVDYEYATGSYAAAGYDAGGRKRWEGSRATNRSINVSDALEPLIRQIRQYDEARLELEHEGGTLASLKRITAHLSQVIAIKGLYRPIAVQLADQAAIRRMLLEVSAGRVHLQVRQLDSGMPVYYVCRTREDYWSQYSVIVEDLYRSPGYPMDDARFVNLMKAGHETYHLRLSPYRVGVAEMVADGLAEAPEWKVDGVLHSLGRHVFQAAWHEDQRAAVLVARHFYLPHFREAVELLYLCLSGELCELRSAVDDDMLAFFEDVYPQRAIRGFLLRLDDLEGGALNEVPRAALASYSRLLTCFGRFLRANVQWGPGRAEMPLYKLVFGNFGRLDRVAAELEDDKAVREQRDRLEGVAGRMIEAIAAPTGTSSHGSPSA